MRHLNYSHLLYFWTVAREGSVARAAELLHLTAQTVSGQIRTLEKSIDSELFVRDGRRMVLSEMGKMVYEYADEIFSIGTELAQMVRGQNPRAPAEFTVGVTDVVPKLVAATVLSSVNMLEEPVRIICMEGKLEALLAELAIQNLDMVLSDRPAPEGLNIRVFSHKIGESSVSFFAPAATARKLRSNFPQSLDGCPILLPTRNTALRRAIDEWLENHEVVPQIMGEFEDSALLKAFGARDLGVFPGPTVLKDSICRQYHVSVVGRADELVEVFYAISPERRIKHPGVGIVTEHARTDLFV